MEFTKDEKDDLLKVFNNVINEIETTEGRVLGMYDVKKLTSEGIPLIDICIKNTPIACLKDGFEKWLNSL